MLEGPAGGGHDEEGDGVSEEKAGFFIYVRLGEVAVGVVDSNIVADAAIVSSVAVLSVQGVVAVAVSPAAGVVLLILLMFQKVKKRQNPVFYQSEGQEDFGEGSRDPEWTA